MGCGSSTDTKEIKIRVKEVSEVSGKQGNTKPEEIVLSVAETPKNNKPSPLTKKKTDVTQTKHGTKVHPKEVEIVPKKVPFKQPDQREKTNVQDLLAFLKRKHPRPSPVANDPDDPDSRIKARKLRKRLRDAIKGMDITDLEDALDIFRKHGIDDLGEIHNAEQRLLYLRLRRALRQAMMRRHLATLINAIDNANRSQYTSELQSLTAEAEVLRDHLQEIDWYCHDIMEMDQKTIAEIRSYVRPPSSVHEIMAGTYLLLGYPEKSLLDWQDVQVYIGKLGKESLKRLISNFDTVSVSPQTHERVREILGYYDLKEVKIASAGAASFYVWLSNMVDLIHRNRKDTNSNAIGITEDASNAESHTNTEEENIRPQSSKG